MDSGHPTETDYTQSRADDEMQVDTTLALESRNALGEVEMLSPGSSPRSNSLEIADRESPSAPLEAPVSQIPSSNSTLSRPSPQRSSTRRTRVEDDHDDERDRRHPSHRLGSPSHPLNSQDTPFPSSSQSTASIPTDMGSNPSGFPSSHSRPFRFFQHMTPPNYLSNDNSASPIPRNAPQRANVDSGTTPVPESTTNSIPPSDTNAGPASQQTPQPGGNLQHQYLGGFAITIDVNGSATTTPLPGMPAANTTPDSTNTPSTGPRDEHTQTQDRAFRQPAPTQPPPPPPRSQPDGIPFPGAGAGAFADLLTRIGLLAALSFQNPALFEREVDDPERAKKLVEGLEDVPVGLVRRLERVGKSGSEEEGGLGDGGCAVCWERLLFDPDEVTKEEVKAETAKESKDKEEVGVDDTPSSLPSLPSSTSSATLTPETEEKKEKKYQRVVSLPCAHVFHAACLIPWFSKPKQTTCPICRFNIDPENLTYNPGAHRRAAAAGQAPTREDARNEAAETQGRGQEHGRTETGTDTNDGPTEIGIPLMFGGSIPPGVPIPGREGNNNTQPAGTGTVPANTDNTATTNEDGEHDDTGNDSDDNTAAGGDREPHDIVTIGFDMYIGRGPPPFPFRGPGVIQIPLSGPPPHAAATNPTNAPPPAAASNDAPQAPLPIPTAPTVNPDTSSAGTTIDANASGTGTAGQQGSGAQESSNTNDGGRARGAGTTFAIPIPMTQGLGRALGDIFSRILGGSGPSTPAGPAPAAAAAPSTGTTSAGHEQNQSQGPIMFGPERPPTAPSLGPSMPIPSNVGLGFGFGFGGGRGQGVTPIILPFPPRGGVGPDSGRSAGAGNGTNGGARGQGPEQAGQGQGGARGGQPEIVFESVPFFDIVSGLFGPPPPGAGPARGPATAEEGASQQPPQPQPPRQPQEQVHQPGGFGFTWIPGSPPFRAPSSQPPSQQQRQPPKKWVPPPAPGLTLRQRVEKKEKEAGLRCCDVSCGVGPSDDDPWVDVPVEGMKQVTIRDSDSDNIRTEDGTSVSSGGVAESDNKTRQAVCSHTFHSSCLVSTERVALALRDAEVSFVGPEGRKEVEVSCPVCRGAGRVSKEEWDAGVQALG